MINKFNYWYFKDAIPSHICDQIVKTGIQGDLDVALTGKFHDKKVEEVDKKDLYLKRNSSTRWLNERWIYKEVMPYIVKANKNAGWNYQLDIPEHVQFTKYSPKQHYGWHQDSNSEPIKDNLIESYNGKIRKLSATCQLSSPSEYSGGEFQFDFRTYDPNERKAKEHEVTCKEIKTKGSMVIFPSYIWHRVKPVIKGTRYSMVIWILGQPWQ